MKAYDILLDEAGDIRFSEDGDWIIGESDKQHVQDILISDKGWWKNHPQVGVGLEKYIESTGKNLELTRDIRIQLENDGYKVQDLVIDLVNFNNSIINVDRIK